MKGLSKALTPNHCVNILLSTDLQVELPWRSEIHAACLRSYIDTSKGTFQRQDTYLLFWIHGNNFIHFPP